MGRCSASRVGLALVALLICGIAGQATARAEGGSLEETLESLEARKLRPFNLIAHRPPSVSQVTLSSTNPTTTNFPPVLPSPANLASPQADMLHDVEHEPGITWPTTTTTTTTTPMPTTTTSAPRIDDDGSQTSSGGRLIAHLQRITERLSAMESLQVQTFRKLEGLDYRLTRVEVQMQERGENVRGATIDATRRLQQMEGDISRIETLLDVVRDESTAIRASQSELKLLIQSNGQPSSGRAPSSENDVPAPRLQVLLAGMNSLRATATSLREELGYINKNLTLLSNLTRTLERKSNDLALKQDLYRGIAAIKNQDSMPARSLSHFVPTMQSCSTPPVENPSFPRDCSEALSMGARTSGIQQIQPTSSSIPFFAMCEMETRGGGWTIIQNRQDGAINFLREWADYKHGFGNLATEFWLGLEKIHMITNQGVYELLIELTDFGLNQAFAHYNAFAIGSDAEGYDIRLLGAFDGDAGDSLSYHTSMKFSTPDNDQDMWLDGNCARDHTGGWWYRGCDTSNLNGQYLNGPVPQEFEYKGMYWYDYQGPSYSLMKSRMMVRPITNAVGPINVSGSSTAKPKASQVPASSTGSGKPASGSKGNQQNSKQKNKKKESE